MQVIKKTMLTLMTSMLVIGCQPTQKETLQQATIDKQAVNPHDLDALIEQLKIESTIEENIEKIQPIITPDGKIQVDWSIIDTKVKPVDPKSFDYPFLIDSQPVENYAKAYNISHQQAQHAMMLSMASPEVLGKLLDQLSDYYLGHEIVDGDKVKLVVYTTDQVIAEQHHYVFADKFAEGLVLPIEIKSKTNIKP